MCQRRLVLAFINQAVINLVHNQVGTMRRTQGGNGAYVVIGNHRAGGVGRRSQQHGFHRWRPVAFHQSGGELEATARIDRHRQRLRLDKACEMAITRVARVRHHHRISRVGERTQRQQQCA